MASNWMIEQDVDLRCGAQTPQIWPNALMLIGDNLAHTWRVRVFDGGGAVALTGATVTGYFVRTDGNTVAVQGSVEGSTAIVTLAQACYAFEGDLKGVMRLTLGGYQDRAIIRTRAALYALDMLRRMALGLDVPESVRFTPQTTNSDLDI